MNINGNLDKYKWQFGQLHDDGGLERDISAQIYFTIRANTFTYLDKITNLHLVELSILQFAI